MEESIMNDMEDTGGGLLNYNLNNLSFTTTDPVTISVENLSIEANLASKFARFQKKKKQDVEKLSSDDSPAKKSLLTNISLQLPPGEILAIIGGSGSGKTTLLNMLANRTSSNISKFGTVLYNGSHDLNSVSHAYVIQQDILLPTLTVEETLYYASELKSHDNISHAGKKILVDEIILELGLKECRNTRVGDSSHKGLSGGEKRRLSIAIQMLSNPSVLFLDEPTTGLDAYSAFLLVQTLKKLTRLGKSFILSIHQPRSDIFFLFDQVVLLSGGKLIYSDYVNKIIDYFGQLGHQVPSNVNPADWLIDLISIDKRNKQIEVTTTERLKGFVSSWRQFEERRNSIKSQSPVIEKNILLNNSHSNISSHRSVKKNPVKSIFTEIYILTKRNCLLTIRDPISLFALYFESIFIAIICGWVFYKPGKSLTGIRSYGGALYISNGLQGYLMLIFEIYRLTSSDIAIFDRERNEGSVTPLGFLVARRLSKLILEDIWVPLCYSVITFFMFGLTNDSPKNFFVYFATMLLVHQTAMTLGMFAVTVSRDFNKASLIGNLNFTLQSLACGFFVNAVHMPVYVRWTKYIAYIWYAFGCNVSNQFTGFMGDCPFETEEACTAYDGRYIVRTYGFWENWITVPLVILFGWSCMFYICAFITLNLKKVDVSLARQYMSKSSGADEFDANDIQLEEDDDQRIDIVLKDIFLGVEVNKIPKFPLLKNHLPQKLRPKDKVILNNINAVFRSGKLNAIMGPSGSGKSSLLNFISGRLNSTLLTKYSSSGSVIFNGKIIPRRFVNSICSYVSQDDDNLLATLTVRETLNFAALLRLSDKIYSTQQKRQAVDDIISQMGLTDCRDTLIGSEFVKGCSGGEKRRVSIAIQLLNNPKVLLLDEPTSGLDSFTAKSILEILNKLAVQGRTVIMTIHQPRYDLFESFGQILLLAKFGHVAFNGSPSELLTYFSDLGYPCPELTNAADHVLDLISINTQTTALEVSSSKRVRSLLSNWEVSYGEALKISEDFIESDSVPAEFIRFIRVPANFAKAYGVLSRRMYLTTMRNIDVVLARLLQVVGIAVLTCLFWAPVGHDYIAVGNRLMLIQQVTPLCFIGMLNNIASYPLERNFFYEEYNDNVYGAGGFFLAYLTIEIPFEFISGALFSVLIVFAIGLPRTPGLFFAVWYAAFALVNVGESIGISFNSIFSHAGFAVNIISLFLSIATFMAGLLSLNMPGFLKGVNYLSPLNYAVTGIINLSMPADLKFTCDSSSMKPDGSCIFSNGTEVLEGYGLKHDPTVYLCCLLVVVIIYRFISFLFLRLRIAKIDITHMKWRSSN